MGHYYVEKIRGSTWVALARKTKNINDKNKAIEALTRASEHYKNFVELATKSHINTLQTNRVGILEWKKQIEYVMADIGVARSL